VVAVVAAGIVFGSQGRAHLSRDGWTALSAIWTQLSFWASSLIFVLAAMLAPRPGRRQPRRLGLLLLLVACALLARAMMIYGALPLMEITGLAARVQSSYKHVMLWGGLRGAITLALALAVTENPWYRTMCSISWPSRHRLRVLHPLRPGDDAPLADPLAASRSPLAARGNPAANGPSP
jgi:NhaP-type Na+/H+ or K+/H+ antiporter